MRHWLCISQIVFHQLHRLFLFNIKNNEKLVFFLSFAFKKLVCISSRLDEENLLVISCTLDCIWGKLFEVFCSFFDKIILTNCIWDFLWNTNRERFPFNQKMPRKFSKLGQVLLKLPEEGSRKFQKFHHENQMEQ